MKTKYRSLTNYIRIKMIISLIIPIILIALVMIPAIEYYLLVEDNERSHILSLSLGEDINNALKVPTNMMTNVYNQLYKGKYVSSDRINEYLESITENSNYFDSIMILNKEGIIKHINSRSNTYLGLDMSNESYYIEAKKLNSPYWSPAFYSTNKSKVTVSYTLPVNGDYLVANLNVNKISNFAESMKHLDNSYVEVIDQRGTYIAHPDMKKVFEKQTSEEFKIYQSVLNNGESSTQIYYNGDKMVANIVKMDDPEWIIAVVRPYSEIVKPARVTTIIVGIGLILSTLLVYLFSFLSNKKWISAFLDFKDSILSNAESLEVIKVKNDSFYELNELSDAFNSTMAIISDREKKLKDRAEEERIISQLSSLMVKGDYNKIMDTIGEVLKQLSVYTGVESYHTFIVNKNYEKVNCRSFEANESKIKYNDSLKGFNADEFLNFLSKAYTEESGLSKSLVDFFSKYTSNTAGIFAKSIRIQDGFVVLIAFSQKNEKISNNDLNNLVAELTAYTVEKAWFVENLTELKNKAEAANHVKNRFLANMSHEIRTPMNGIIGMTQILELSDVTSDQRESISILKDSSKRMMTLVNNILYITSLEQGDIPVSKNRFKLQNLLSQVAGEYEKDAKIKNIKIIIKVDIEIQSTLIGDSAKIALVLKQLIENSIKFSDSGYINVHASLESPSNENNIVVRLSIADTGIGIQKEELPRLFDYFTQLDDTCTKKFQGAGLGLAICKRLVEILGGRIEVESTPGYGSTFSIYIGLESESTIVNQVTLNKSRESVLIADDDEPSRKVLGILCEKNGFEVSYAEDGKDAIDKCKDKTYDLIFMDIQMPEIDGVKATKIIRDLYSERQIKIQVIAITAYALAGDRERFLSQGFDDYVSKPIDVEQFSRMLKSREW